MPYASHARPARMNSAPKMLAFAMVLKAGWKIWAIRCAVDRPVTLGASNRVWGDTNFPDGNNRESTNFALLEIQFICPGECGSRHLQRLHSSRRAARKNFRARSGKRGDAGGEFRKWRCERARAGEGGRGQSS